MVVQQPGSRRRRREDRDVELPERAGLAGRRQAASIPGVRGFAQPAEHQVDLEGLHQALGVTRAEQEVDVDLRAPGDEAHAGVRE